MRRRLIALALVAFGSAVAAGCDAAPIEKLIPCVETDHEADESTCSYIPIPGDTVDLNAVDVSGL
ncbi:MAG: hypothetical protein AB7L13_19210 [Acidimicrobiia bacterium]